MIVLGYNISRLDVYKHIKTLYNFENLKTLKNIFNNTFTEELVDFPDISVKAMTFLIWSYCKTVCNYYELGKSIPEDCATIAIGIQEYSEILKQIKQSDKTEEEKKTMFLHKLVNIIISNKATELLYVIVKFPEITIQQSVFNTTHTIYDLYVKIPIAFSGKLAIPEFFVQRGVITSEEYLCGYSHSHAPQSNMTIPKWLRFCTGTGPLRTLSEKLFLSFNSKLWIVYLTELNRALPVESEQGGPHIRMNKLSSFKTKTIQINIPDHTYTANFDRGIFDNHWSKQELYFINNYLMPSIDKFIYRVGTEFYIKNHLTELCKEFTKIYNEFSEKTGYKLYPIYYLHKIVDRTFYYYDINDFRFPANNNLGYIFHFKGQPVHRKIKNITDLEQLKFNMIKVADPQAMVNLLIRITNYLQSYEYNKIKQEYIKNAVQRADTDYLCSKARINPRERFLWDS